MIEKKKTVIGRVRTGNLRMYICADALANLSYYDDWWMFSFFLRKFYIVHVYTQ